MLNKHKKIYITGHNGMVGAAIINTLRTRGYSNLIHKKSNELDLRDNKKVFKYIESSNPDLVIHTAAKVGGIQANIDDPVSFMSDNLMINFNVINACLKYGIKDLIFLGSSCMYPKDYKNPLKEEYILDAPLEPTNEGYALSKICGSKYCEYINKQYGLNYKTIIPCNLFGENDHFDSKRSHLLAAIIDKVYKAKMNNDRMVTIWGDGTVRREFLYVKDLADFIVDNLDNLNLFPNNLNIGYGKDYSVNEYYEIIGNILEYNGEFEHDLSRPVGMKRKLMDSSRAYKLGWKPNYNLKDALINTYQFYLNETKK